MPTNSRRRDPITPEMAEAGRAAYLEWASSGEEVGVLIRAIYTACQTASRDTSSAVNSLRSIPQYRIDKFWSFVNVAGSNDCWTWKKSPKTVYPRFSVGRKVYAASHVALATTGRFVPLGHVACHRCDNPVCVNPNHLFASSQKDNIRDCVLKGRRAKHKKKRVKCRRGHDLTPENSRERITKAGYLAIECKTCKRISNSRIYTERKSKLSSDGQCPSPAL